MIVFYYCKVGLHYNFGDKLMTLNEKRRYWFGKYVAERDRASVARQLGYNDNVYINQVIAGHSSLGNKNAERWCDALKLPAGWFDRPVPDDSADSSPDIGSFTDALSKISRDDKLRIFELMTQTLPPSDVAKIISFLSTRLESDLARVDT